MSYKIVLDAGHGGTDPGAIYKERKEKDDNLELTRAVGKILEDNGIDVVYTRTTDVYQTPFEKARIANEVGADYFISFHRNSSPKENQYQGVEVLVYDEGGLFHFLSSEQQPGGESVQWSGGAGLRQIRCEI